MSQLAATLHHTRRHHQQHPHTIERESLRHALRSSLDEILGDLTTDAEDTRAGTIHASPSIKPSTMPVTITLNPQVSSTMHPANHLNHRGTLPPNSVLSQSLGLSAVTHHTYGGGSMMGARGFSAGHCGLSPADDILLAAAEARYLAQGRALFLERKIAQQKSRFTPESYITMFTGNKTSSALHLPFILPSKSSSVHQNTQQHPMATAANTADAQEDTMSHEQAHLGMTLQALGQNLRSRMDPYIDVSSYVDPVSESTPAHARSRGGVSEPFPEKLHRMLSETEKDGQEACISWCSHGRAFVVHDTTKFMNEIMPKFFKQTKWNSFARQMNLYGFLRISSGPDAGGYYHELFLRNKPSLCMHMRRVGVPHGEDRRKLRSKNDIADPDFYAMKPVA